MTTLAVPDSDDSKNITMDEKDASVPATATSQATTLAVDKESDVRTEVGTETSRSTKEDEEEYPSGIKLLIISIALCLAVFLVALVS
jgi:hypothetical protein